MVFLRQQFPEKFVGDTPAPDLALFPNFLGRPSSKKAFTETIRAAARHLGQALSTPDGSEKVAGHSLRPTGAQGLTRLGLDAWTVQVLGRWGGGTVMKYIRSAATGPSAAASRHWLGASLRDVVAQTQNKIDFETLEARVQGTVAEATARARMDISAELRAEFTEALRAALASRPVSSSSSSSASSASAAQGEPEVTAEAPQAQDEQAAEEAVSSAAYGLKHRILIGPRSTFETHAWVTTCGWKFGQKGSARDALPSDRCCRKCWPA